MSSTMSLGKVRCTPKGVWSAASAYEYLDILTYAGRSYIVCYEDGVPAGTSLDNTTYYQLLADIGAGGEILAATATIDNTYGTPTVEVVLGGTTHSRTFEFDFKHLLGNGIESIELYSTSGRTKTYRITYSSGGHFDFDVIDGSGISNIEKTGTSGLIDTYTITCQDGSTYTFTVTNGKSISTIAKTGTSGLVDTYTITYNDGSTDTFTVTNGQDYDLSVLAPDYDNTATYNVGDYVNHSTGLYKCIYPITVAEEWNSAHWAGIILGEEIQNKANKTGYYDGMSVAGADNLITAKKETDTEPYNYRTTGGNVDVGSQENFKSLVGGTLAMNQLVKATDLRDSGTVNGLTFTNNNDGSITISGICNAETTTYTIIKSQIALVKDHIYFCGINNPKNLRINFAGGVQANTVIAKASISGVHGAFLEIPLNEDFTTPVTLFPQIVDLTAKFGTIPQTVGGNSYNSIADYVYGLSGTNGVAWLYKYFPILNGGYIPFTNPNLQSVCCDKHITNGLNQWDEEWEVGSYDGNGQKYASSNKIRSTNKIRVLPNTVYMITPTVQNLCGYDIDKKFVGMITTSSATGGRTFLTPENVYYIAFNMGSIYGTTYNNDICIHLEYDGEMDGVYEPYESHTYDMGHETLRGVYMLDSFGNLYLDPSKNDTKTPDGEITRRRGKTKLSEMTGWVRENYGTAENPVYRFRGNAPSDYKLPTGVGSRWQNLICTGYTGGSGPLSAVNSADKQVAGYDNDVHLYFTDYAFTDTTTFLSAHGNDEIEYPLATPTTESGTAYTELQKCHNWGTEEQTDYEVGQGNRVVSIPVGHVTEYPVDLKAKLEMSPDFPADGDGDYIVRVANGEASYVKLGSAFPAMPSEAGSYVLGLTVADGVGTMSWVADT